MKILHVIATMDPKAGGVCQAVRTLIGGLAQLGVENEVASLDNRDASFIQGELFPIHALGPAKGPWAHSKMLMPWFLENMERFQSVVVHGLWLYPSYATSKALRLLKKKNNDKYVLPKLFIMPHGMLDPYFQKASNRKIKALRNKIYWRIIESKVINNANALFFTCEEELLLARKPFSPYHPQKELVVGLGVDKPPIFKPAMQEAFFKKCPTLKNQKYFIFIGRIHEKKGVDLLIEAYRSFLEDYERKQNKESVTKLLIAGPGLETPFGKQVQQSAKNGLHQNILFPDMLSGDEKWGAFYGCEAFILPSHQENFGIAVVEALACGKPVLISNQVNIWREIKESGAGVVNDDSLAGTRQLLDDWNCLTLSEQKAMQKSAKDCYDNQFSTVPAATRFLNALNL